MNSDFEDPNNHVPEVTPDDGWGDDAAEEKPAVPAPRRLPSKKADRGVKTEAPVFEVREVVPTADPVQDDEAFAPVILEVASAPFEDPNNHVPKLTAVDDWEDEEPAVIPRKRAADQRPAGYAAKAVEEADDGKGLEIGMRELERSQDSEGRSAAQRLEVTDHTPRLTVPEAGVLPRVVPKQVIEKKESSQQEETADTWHGRTADTENWGKQRSLSTRWMVISGAVLAVTILAGVILLPKFGWKNERGVRTNFSNLEVFEAPMLDVDPARSFELAEGIEAKAKALVESYVKAASVEDILPLVRDRDRVEKSLRERWTPMGLPASWHVPDESKWEILKSGTREYGFLTGLLPDVTPFRFYIVQEGEKALLDWEASSGFSETKFEDLAKRQGEGGIVRGYVSPGDLYTFSLPESDYQCFRITSANAETSIWGYARRKDPVAEKLAEPFVPGVIPREIQSESPMTLKLEKGPAEALPNQWIISELVHLEWLTP